MGAMKSLALLASGAVLLGAIAQRQAPLPSALANHFDKLSSTKSLKAVYTVRPIGGAATEYTLELSKPGFFKLTSDEGFTVSDGKTITAYTKATNTYTETPVSDKSLLELSRKPEYFAWAGFIAKDAPKDLTLARASAPREFQGNDVTPVDFTAKLGTKGTLYIDKKLGIARGYDVKFGEKELILGATKLEVKDETRAATEFAFVAPDGAKKAANSISDATYASVQSLMNAQCMPCHSEDRHRGDVDLSNYDGIKKVVNPGDGANSELVQVMRSTGPDHMPKNRPSVPEEQIKLVEKWINDGAKK